MLEFLQDIQHKVGDRYYARLGTNINSNLTDGSTTVTKADYGTERIVRSELVFKCSTITPDDPKAISQAKHRAVRQIHSMFYGTLIRELNEIRCELLYKDDRETSDKIDNIINRLEL